VAASTRTILFFTCVYRRTGVRRGHAGRLRPIRVPGSRGSAQALPPPTSTIGCVRRGPLTAYTAPAHSEATDRAERSRREESLRSTSGHGVRPQIRRIIRDTSPAVDSGGRGFDPPKPFPVQWFSTPFRGGRSIGSSQFTPIKWASSEHDLGADWGLSAPGHGQRADSPAHVSADRCADAQRDRRATTIHARRTEREDRLRSTACACRERQTIGRIGPGGRVNGILDSQTRPPGRMIAPASRSFLTTKASFDGMDPSSSTDPPVVGRSNVS
jgi:hypothetical protein